MLKLEGNFAMRAQTTAIRLSRPGCWFLIVVALSCGGTLAYSPSVCWAADSAPGTAGQTAFNRARVAGPGNAAVLATSSPILIAGWYDKVEGFFWSNRAWILTIAMGVVALGFVLLYKGWK